MAVQIQLRRGTASQWTSANPTLAIGEMGVETDTDQFKIGDGTTAWNSLAYGGIQGPTGPTGPQGPTGPTGATGPTGPAGTVPVSPTFDFLTIDYGIQEKFSVISDATGVVTHNCRNGHIFYHTSPDTNWTANFTNLSLSSGYATTLTLVIDQGATGYYPNAVQIEGVAQTINWQGNATPTPSTNRTDVVSFSITNSSGTYNILGQLTGF